MTGSTASGPKIAQAEQLTERLGEERVFQITGHRITSTLSGPKILWLRDHEPEVFARTHKFLHVKDYVAHRMTGQFVTDRSDGRLGHLDGLNLSRAWMLEGIATALPPCDRRIAVLRAAADEHRAVALPTVSGEHYAGGHWLGTFALYLASGADTTRGR